MQAEGWELRKEARHLAESFKHEIITNPQFQSLSIDLPMVPRSAASHVIHDPTKIPLNTERLAISTEEIKDYLFLHHGIYVNRITEKSMLLNFHIGITKEATVALLAALSDLLHQEGMSAQAVTSTDYIIPYPPGVPLIVPGDQITAETHREIDNIRKRGILVFNA
ncbi:ornithine decarboxylase [Caldimonas brevitalea]|uniref:Ornithine decarboxylase n=2 Tax=Caldimonas brevitalea TaxID=413882 RepID=A0A0G3BTX9_9BURK|nr:ornithine decarboxylase [Caldimonas brevitalea]